MINYVMNTKISRKKVSKMIGYNLQFALQKPDENFA